MIETNGVTISSVSVTIKALKVNNRQMTQAVFNQLPKMETLVEMRDADTELLKGYKLRGNLWGWVNYCPKDSDPELRQVVLEADGKLYRTSAPTEHVNLREPRTHDEFTADEVSLLYEPLMGSDNHRNRKSG